jgi:hypothetical protein
MVYACVYMVYIYMNITNNQTSSTAKGARFKAFIVVR